MAVDGSLDGGSTMRGAEESGLGNATSRHGGHALWFNSLGIEHHTSSHYDACDPLGEQSMQWRQTGAIDRPAYCHARPRLEVDERLFPCCAAPPSSTVWPSYVDSERYATISMEVCGQWRGYSNSCR